MVTCIQAFMIFSPGLDGRFANNYRPTARSFRGGLVGAGTKLKKTPLYSAFCMAAGRSAVTAAAIIRVCQRHDIACRKTLLWRRRQIPRDGVGGAHCIFSYK
jgi:hypothetical protein